MIDIINKCNTYTKYTWLTHVTWSFAQFWCVVLALLACWSCLCEVGITSVSNAGDAVFAWPWLCMWACTCMHQHTHTHYCIYQKERKKKPTTGKKTNIKLQHTIKHSMVGKYYQQNCGGLQNTKNEKFWRIHL